MSFASLAAIYFIVWWVVLFAILPIGVRTEDDESRIAPGTVPSAPIRPMLWWKALATSIVTAVIVAAIWFVRVKLGIDLEALGQMFGPAPAVR
jgi:predicted secreted protein